MTSRSRTAAPFRTGRDQLKTEVDDLRRQIREISTAQLRADVVTNAAAIVTNAANHDLAEVVRMAKSDFYVGSANRINVTEGVEITMTFDIPATWNTWDVQVACSWTVFEDLTATGNTFIRFRIRKTNVSGDVWGANAQSYPDASPNDKSASLIAHAEGQTDTGTVTIVWTGDAGANSEIFAWDEFELTLTAWRVT